MIDIDIDIDIDMDMDIDIDIDRYNRCRKIRIGWDRMG